MRKAFVVFAATFMLAGCGGLPGVPAALGGSADKSFLVSVGGTDGTPFSGGIEAITADGKSTSQTVDGTVPEAFPAQGTIVSVEFQKKLEPGTLTVDIQQGDNTLAHAETTAAYGVVTAASPAQ